MGRRLMVEEGGLVTTIIPVFNREHMLGDAVTSVLRQTYSNIEIIIVNDGSTDGSLEVAESFRKDRPDVISILSQGNVGPGLARQAGLESSKGEYIQYLDSDDRLLPNKFECQVRGLINNPECGVSYGATIEYLMGETPPKEASRKTGLKYTEMFPKFLEERFWHTVTPLYRRTVCMEAGPWLDLKQEEDWEYDCRIASMGVKLHWCPELVAEQIHHHGHRLGLSWRTDVTRLEDKIRARQLILMHARRYGIRDTAPEMQHFARDLFRLARQSGNMGFGAQAEKLFELSKDAAGVVGRSSAEYKIYKFSSAIFGWEAMGKMSAQLDKIRRKFG